MRDCAESLPLVLGELDRFGKQSGIRVYMAKSCLVPLSEGKTIEWPCLPVHGLLASHTFKYLEIRIYWDPNDTVQSNLGQAMMEARSSIAFRSKLPLSVMVALSKIVMLPRLLYCFAVIPLQLKTPFFQELSALLMELKWGENRRWVPLEMYLPLDEGAQGILDFKSYYLVAPLQCVAGWFDLGSPLDCDYVQEE